jgi:hypothetical protein
MYISSNALKEVLMMKEELSEMERESREPTQPIEWYGSLDDALERIYEIYGRDLSSFLHDVYREQEIALKLQKQAEDSMDAILFR